MPKLTDKTELNATPASNDLIHIVDVSDTTSSPQGTSKRNTVANFKADLVPYTGATSDVNLGSNNITANNLSGTNTGDQDLSGLVQKVAMTDNTIVRANGASGDIQGSGATINDNGLLTASSLYSLTSGSNEAIVSASNVLGSAADAPHATLQAYSSSGGDARVRLGVVSDYYTIGLDQSDSKLKFDLGQVVGGNTFLDFDGTNSKFYGTVNLNSLTASTPLALNANKEIISNPSKYLIYSALATQFIANNTPTTVLFPTPDVSTFGTDIAYSAGIFTNNSGETLTLEVSYSVRFNFITAGALYGGRIIISSSTIYYAQSLGHSFLSGATAITGTSLVQIPNGGTLRVEVYQNSGATRDISIPVGSGASVITIKKI